MQRQAITTSKILFISIFGILISACSASAQTETAEVPDTIPLSEVVTQPTAVITPDIGPTPSVPPVTEANQIARRVDEFGVEMALIPEGIFTMGSDSGAANEGPAHAIHTDAVYMDIYEATNSQFEACVKATACGQPQLIDGYQNNPDYADHPIVNVTWGLATQYCEWRGGRLPTEAEWEKAAGWDPLTGEMRSYPWGEEAPNGSLANTRGAEFGGTAKVGSYELGRSALGLYDMAGNVWEWVSDTYAGDYYASSEDINPTGPDWNTGLRILRGGGYNDNDFYARTSARTGVGPQWSSATGVRCVVEP